MILIYSKDVDEFVNQVIDYLDEEFIRIGNRDIIEIDEIASANDPEFRVRSNYFEAANFRQCKSVWFNGGGVKGFGTSYENQCYQSLIDSYLTYLPIKKIGRIYNEFETNKLYALLEAERQGLKTPETLITGSKEKLMEFYTKYDGNNGIICKRIIDQYYYRSEDYTYNFNSTFLIDYKILNDIPNEFAFSLFQERILAEFEIRVIYIEGNFYAMSVHVFDKSVDYRKNLASTRSFRTIPFNLPKNIQVKLKNVFTSLNINYGSADLMYCDGEFYFLEINPSGQISFVNEACNFYLEEEISKMLKDEKERAC